MTRPFLVVSLLALSACTMEPPPAVTPPVVTGTTTVEDPTTGGDFVCVTSSYDLTECTPREGSQPSTSLL